MNLSLWIYFFALWTAVTTANVRPNRGLVNQRYNAPIQAKFSPSLEREADRLDWMNYIQEVFWKAGNYHSMEKVFDIIKGIREPTNPQAKVEYMRLRNKVRLRIEKYRKLVPRKPRIDQFINECTDLLLHRGFPDAKAFFKLNAAKNVRNSLQISDELKTLIIALRMIKFDARHNRPEVPLWESYMRYNADHKMETMKYLKGAKKNMYTGTLPNVPLPWSVQARLSIILGEDITTHLKVPELATNPVESNLLRGYASLQRGDHCGAVSGFTKALKSASDELVRKVIRKKISIQKPKCILGEKTKTFNSFCQMKPGTEFPISAASLSDPQANEIAKIERLFWTAVWAADCKIVGDEFAALQKVLGQRVRTDSFVKKRLGQMRALIGQCKKKEDVTFRDPLGEQVLQHLRKGESAIAIGIAKSSVNRKLYLAALVHMFPRAAYSPCLGGSLLSANVDESIRLLERVQIIQNNERKEKCQIQDNDCYFADLQAHFILANLAKAKKAAAAIDPRNPHCKSAVQMLTCLELCSADKDPRLACKVKQHLAQLGPEALSQPNMKIAQALAKGFDGAPQMAPHETKSRPLDRIFDDIKKDIGRQKQDHTSASDQSNPGSFSMSPDSSDSSESPRSLSSSPSSDSSNPSIDQLISEGVPSVDLSDIPMPSMNPASPVLGGCGPKAIPLPNQVVQPGSCPQMVVPPTNPDGTAAPFVCPFAGVAITSPCNCGAVKVSTPCQAAQAITPCQAAQAATPCQAAQAVAPPCQNVVVSPQGTPICGIPQSQSQPQSQPQALVSSPNTSQPQPVNTATNPQAQTQTQPGTTSNQPPTSSTAPKLSPKEKCDENARLLRVQLNDLVKKFTENCGKVKEEITSQGGTPVSKDQVVATANQLVNNSGDLTQQVSTPANPPVNSQPSRGQPQQQSSQGPAVQARPAQKTTQGPVQLGKAQQPAQRTNQAQRQQPRAQGTAAQTTQPNPRPAVSNRSQTQPAAPKQQQRPAAPRQPPAPKV